MAEKKFTTTLEIQAQADQAEETIGKIGTQLSKLWKHTQASKGTLSDLETLREKMASIKVAMEDVERAGGKTDALGLSTIGKDAKGLIKITHELQRELKLLTEEQKQQMLSDTEKKAWEARAAAIRTYYQELEKAQKLSRERIELTAQRDSKVRQRDELKAPTLSDRGAKAKEYTEKQDRLAKITANVERDRASGRFSEKEGSNNQLTRAIEQAKQLQEELAAAKLELGGEAGLAEAIADLQSYRQALSETEEAGRVLDREIEELAGKISQIAPDEEAEALERFKKALKAMGVEGVDAAKNSEELVKILKQLDKQALEPVNQSVEALSAEYGTLGEEAMKMAEKINESNRALEAQRKAAQEREAFEGKIKQFLGMQGAAQLMRSALRDAISTITELDATMAQMAVVTDLSIGDYWDQLPEYSKRASELGISINSAYEAATLYYQQGLKTNEVIAISNETLKMAKIAGLNAADATDKMTAALRGFNMELNETSARNISDVYSKLAAITAADVNEISDAMTKTASIASSAGMEFETTAAFLSQIIETTRESAETAGTALKTVIARFQELKKDPSEIGEVDGEIVDANAIETALRKVGVALRDTSGQFRDLDDVFLELSEKWNTLDKNTQRYIATIAAGSRQQSRFIAMMQDYGRTQELVTAANNSAGASQAQFEKTMESLEAKVEKLKNAWHEFTMGIMNSDFVKLGVDILTKFLEVINKATSAFDGLGGSITKIATILTIFKVGKTLFQKIPENFKAAMIEVIRHAIEGGEKAAEGAAEGAQRKAEELKRTGGTATSQSTEAKPTEEQASKGIKGFVKEEAKRIGAAVVDSTGFNDYKKAHEQRKAIDNYRAVSNIAPEQRGMAKRAREDQKRMLQDKLNAGPLNPKATKEIKQEIDQLDKEIQGLSMSAEDFEKAHKEMWDNITSGINKTAQAATNAGVAFSVFGGILSSMGFEEAGDAVAQLGNYLMLAGTAISTLSPLVTTFAKKLEKSGKSVQKAWIWVTLIVAAVVALIAVVSNISKSLKENSLEGQLEKAQNAADGAAEAADKLAEAYQNLKNSLDGVASAQSTLNGLTEGTTEWKDAVEGLNEEVINLIREYPELAKFVKNKQGVLTIDIDSAAVQNVLAEAKETMINANVAETMAGVRIAQINDQLLYKNLDERLKPGYVDPDAAAAAAQIGVTTAAATAGGFTGMGIASVIPIPALTLAVGFVAGSVIGGLASQELAEEAGEAAREAAETANYETQVKIEQLSQALASGDLIKTANGYELMEGVSEREFELRYSSLEIEELDDFFTAIGEGTDKLVEFGNALIQNKESTKSYYDAAAAQIFQTFDTSSWTEVVYGFASSVFNGETLETVTTSVANDLGDIDFLDKNLDEASKNRRDKAIQDVYGVGATLQQTENGYSIINAKGETLQANIDSAGLRTVVATAEAKEQFKNTDEDIEKITQKVQDGLEKAIENGDPETIKKTVATLLTDPSGESLTREMLTMLGQITDEELQAIFDSSPLFKAAFETVDNFKSKINTPQESAEKILNDATAFFDGKGLNIEGFTSGILATLSKDDKLGSLYSKGSESEIAAFEQAFNNLADQDNLADIVDFMGTIDWSNEESLLQMQYKLMEVYGVSEDEAKALTDSMIAANHAMSSLTFVVDEFGKSYQAIQKVAQATNKLNDLQWDYQRLLNSNASALEIQNNIEEQRQTILAKGNAAIEAYNAKYADSTIHYGAGVSLISGYDLTKYVNFDPTTGMYDLSEFQQVLNSLQAKGEDGKEDYKKAVEWYNSLEQFNKDAQEQIDIAKESYDQLEELNQQAKEAYQNLYEQIGEMLATEMEKSISVQEEILDATRTANEKIVSKIQEQIDEDRQAREKEKKEKDLANLQSKMAYLGMDSSGGNSLELLELENQYEERSQDFEDYLIDQSLQDLQDANARAEEQRERQIEIANQQLEAYKNSDEFFLQTQTLLDQFYEEYRNITSQGLVFDPKDTTLGERLGNAFTSGLNQFQEQQFWKSIKEDVATSAYYADGTLKNEQDMGELLSGIEENTSIDKLTNVLWADKLSRASAQQAEFSTNSGENGFKPTTLMGKTVESYGGNISQMSSDITAADSAFSVSNASALAGSDTQGENEYKIIQTYASGYGKEFSENAANLPLSKENFYNILNSGGSVSSPKEGEDFTQDRLINSLSTGTKLSGIDAYAGSYEHYIEEFKQGSTYNQYYSETGRSNERDEIERELAKILDQIQRATLKGRKSIPSLPEYSDILGRYQNLGGDEADLQTNAIKYMAGGNGFSYGTVDGVEEKNTGFLGLGSNKKLDGIDYSGEFSLTYMKDQEAREIKNSIPRNGYALYDGVLYKRVYSEGNNNPSAYTPGSDTLYQITDQNVINAYRRKLNGYKTGGLADFTGPAWLDGTPSKPEYILNARQTERFFSLVDVLEGFKTNTEPKKSSGDNYFDINISVEKIEDDYDVEQMANKIRSMIYDDATYRNVNAINHIR